MLGPHLVVEADGRVDGVDVVRVGTLSKALGSLGGFVAGSRRATELLVNRERILVVVRTPPDVSLYHRRSNPFFPKLLNHLGHEPDVQAVVLPRSPEQRDYVRSLGLPSVIVPDSAVDAQSLIALSDLVVSAGGTMNREAAALGVPVYTTYGGRIGGVDEMLIRDGRLRPLTDPRALELEKRDRDGSAPANHE